MTNVIHTAERKAFQLALDRVVHKAKEGNAAEVADSLINLIQKILGDTWKDETYRNFTGSPEIRTATGLVTQTV